MSMLRQDADARLDGYVYAGPRPHSSPFTMSLKSVLTTVVAGSHYLVHPQVLVDSHPFPVHIAPACVDPIYTTYTRDGRVNGRQNIQLTSTRREPQGTIEETIKPDVIIPVTVLETRQLQHNLDSLLRLYDFYDDVFNPEFGNVLIEKPNRKPVKAAQAPQADQAPQAATSVVGHGKSVMRLREDDTAAASATKASVYDLPPGPYILHGPNVHQAWRIYNDTMDAFAWGVYPDKVDENDVYGEASFQHEFVNF